VPTSAGARRPPAAGGAVEWARQRRATHVEVAVHDFNRDARRFYESFGFAASVDRLILAA
jgi:hypothetical protein